jgi:hypothetical protein
LSKDVLHGLAGVPELVLHDNVVVQVGVADGAILGVQMCEVIKCGDRCVSETGYAEFFGERVGNIMKKLGFQCSG